MHGIVVINGNHHGREVVFMDCCNSEHTFLQKTNTSFVIDPLRKNVYSIFIGPKSGLTQEQVTCLCEQRSSYH